MTTARNIWSHTEAMTWTSTVSLHQSNSNSTSTSDDITQPDYNVTTSTVLIAPDVTPTQWQLVRFLVIVIASLLSNLLIVVTVKRSPRLQSLVYFYMSSLAVMDILDSLLVMPVAFARNLLNEFTIFSGWCQCWQTVLFGLTAGTMVHILMATLHCYLMLGAPIRYHKYSQSILQVGLAWIIPANLAVPAIVVLVKKHFPAKTIPGWDCAPADASYMTAALVPMYYAPIIVAIVLLVLLAFKVKRQGYMSDQLQCVLPGLALNNGFIHPQLKEKGETKEKMEKKKKADKKAKTEKTSKVPKQQESACSKKIKERRPTGRNKRWRKPLTTMTSTCTMASEYSQGNNSDDCSSISETNSQDYINEDTSIGKDKAILIAEVHSSTLTYGCQLNNTQSDENKNNPVIYDHVNYDNNSNYDEVSQVPEYDNALPSSYSKDGSISSDYENGPPNIDDENAGTNSDYESTGTNSDYENVEPNSNPENAETSSDYENIEPSSDYENADISSDYENADPSSDYENARELMEKEKSLNESDCIVSEKDPAESNELSETDSDTNSVQTKVKIKSGKEQLNEPLDEMDINLTLESVELLNQECGITGSENPAYDQDESDTPLADSIQVKHKSPAAENTEENNDGNSQEGSYGESEPGECGIKGPRRSILRRDGSKRVSKKVQFAIPEGQSNEGKSANRIRRRPTGLRRRTRNSNVVNALNNGTAKQVTNGTLSIITNGVTTIPPSTFEYMMQVQRNQGMKLSRKVRDHQAHFIVLCAMLLVHGILSLPYMFTYTILTFCTSCRDVLPNDVATAFEWMYHASSAVNLLLYILFNSEFRESLSNLCG